MFKILRDYQITFLSCYTILQSYQKLGGGSSSPLSHKHLLFSVHFILVSSRLWSMEYEVVCHCSFDLHPSSFVLYICAYWHLSISSGELPVKVLCYCFTWLLLLSYESSMYSGHNSFIRNGLQIFPLCSSFFSLSSSCPVRLKNLKTL